MGYRDEFDFEGIDLDEPARDYLAEGGGVDQASFFQALLDKRERETTSVYGDVQVPQDVR